MRDRAWPLVTAIVLAAASWVVAGAAVLWATNANQQAVDENRDALIYLCDTTTTLRLVIEQLEVVDRALLKDRSLTLATRQAIASRAGVYRTAVAALSKTAPCEEVE